MLANGSLEVASIEKLGEADEVDHSEVGGVAVCEASCATTEFTPNRAISRRSD